MPIAECPHEPVKVEDIIPGKNDLKNIKKFIEGKKTKTTGKKAKPKIVLKLEKPEEITDVSFKIKKKHIKRVEKVKVIVGDVSIKYIFQTCISTSVTSYRSRSAGVS